MSLIHYPPQSIEQGPAIPCKPVELKRADFIRYPLLDQEPLKIATEWISADPNLLQDANFRKSALTALNYCLRNGDFTSVYNFTLQAQGAIKPGLTTSRNKEDLRFMKCLRKAFFWSTKKLLGYLTEELKIENKIVMGHTLQLPSGLVRNFAILSELKEVYGKLHFEQISPRQAYKIYAAWKHWGKLIEQRSTEVEAVRLKLKLPAEAKAA